MLEFTETLKPRIGPFRPDRRSPQNRSPPPAAAETMVGSHGLDYAAVITTSHFGPTVAAVCTTLLRRGSLSLTDLVRFTALPSSTVKNILLVLIQHNCAQAFSVARPAAGGTVRAVTLYMALFDNIVHRSRFSKFIAVVREDPAVSGDASKDPKKPSVCVNLLEGLLQHGRLTFEQLFVREASKPGNAITRGELRAEFNRLVREEYVERCPRPEPFLSDPDDKPGSSRRRGAKAFEETVTVEQQALTAAALSYAARFSELTDNGADSAVDVKFKQPRLNLAVGEKRKYESLEAGQEVQTSIVDNEVLWRANFDKFIHCLKLKVCTAILKRQLSRDTAFVVDAFMESSQGKFKDKKTVKALVDSILARARMKNGGESLTQADLTTILDKLKCEYSIQESGTLCIIDLKKIIEGSQMDEIEAVVSKRYGDGARKIIRLLVKGDPVETDHISDQAFTDKKAIKGTLCKLWKDDYLDMEKAGSQAVGPMQQQYAWRMNKKALWELVLNDMYHGVLNISLRIAHIAKQLPEAQDAVTEKNLKKGRWVLEASLLKMDDALMVFSDL